jgi:hypothetical protein
MIQVSIKQLEGLKWQAVPLEEMLGKSILHHMLITDIPMVACMYVDQKPSLFISNKNEYVKQYKEKGVSLHVDDMIRMFDGRFDHKFGTKITEVFPDAKFACFYEGPAHEVIL